MQDLDGEGRSLHACRAGEGDLLGDEGSVVTHTLCKIDHHAVVLGQGFDLLGEGDYRLRRNDQKNAVGRAENLFVACGPNAGIQEMGGKILGVSMILIDILNHILLDGPKDDGIGGIP